MLSLSLECSCNFSRTYSFDIISDKFDTTSKSPNLSFLIYTFQLARTINIMAPDIRVPANFGRAHINSPVHGNLLLNLRDGRKIKTNSMIMSLNSPVINRLTSELHQVGSCYFCRWEVERIQPIFKFFLTDIFLYYSLLVPDYVSWFMCPSNQNKGWVLT